MIRKIFLMVFAFSLVVSISERVIAETCTADKWCKQDNIPGTLTDSGYHLTRVYFFDNRTGWAGRSDGMVYRTVDGGGTWAGQKLFINEVKSIQFINSLEGWAADSSNVKHTTDGGVTWTLLYHEDARYIEGLQFVDEKTGYFVCSWDHTLFKTTDGGTTWMRKTLPLYSSQTSVPISLYFYDELNGIIVGNELVSVTRDGGETFTSHPLAAGKRFISATVASPSHMLVAGDDVPRLTTDGASWDVPWHDGGFSFDHSICYDSFISECRFRTIRFVPDSPEGWVVGGQGHILKSTDGGAKWYTHASGSTETLADVAAPDGSFAVVVGRHGTVLIHRPDGQVPSGEQDINASVTVGSLTITVGQNGKIAKSTDGGVTWTTIALGLDKHLNDIKAIGATSFLVVGDDGLILKSTDSGATWTSLYSGINDNLKQLAVASSKIWIVGNGGVILVSSLAGDSWYQQDSRVLTDLNGICAVGENTLFAVGDAGVILSSSNAGDIWTVRSKVTTANLNSVSFSSATNGTIVGDSGLTMTSADGGSTWSIAAAGPSGVADTMASKGGASAVDPQYQTKIRNISYYDNKNAWAVGDAGLVLKTSDGGKTWDRYIVATPYNLTSVKLTGPDSGIITAAQNQIYRIPSDVSLVRQEFLVNVLPAMSILLNENSAK
jgi:photosystem II stability/assembly factor-like uncharacterized protein